jgi:hypothetical protein
MIHEKLATFLTEKSEACPHLIDRSISRGVAESKLVPIVMTSLAVQYTYTTARPFLALDKCHIGTEPNAFQYYALTK